MPSGAHPTTPFKSYSGNDPFVFVSYSHDDAQAVYGELEWLRASGINVWYDEGISPGHSWPEELARAIQRCSAFLLFVTPRSANSENCERETTFALDAQKPFLAIHLEETVLPPGLKLSIGNRQAILRHRLPRGDYREKVASTLAELQGRTAHVPPSERDSKRPGLMKVTAAVATLAVLGIGSTALYRAYERSAQESWARDTALPEIIEHADAGRYRDAFELATRVDAILPDDAVLAELWPRFSSEVYGASEPSGADVYAKPYRDPDAAWQRVGATPFTTRVPMGPYRWRIEKSGYAPKLIARPVAVLSGAEFPPIPLTPAADVAEGMVFIDAAEIILPYAGFPRSEMIAVPAFQIGRHEVTNREFQAFVDAGGYEDERLWQGLPFVDDGRALSLNEARNRFRDATGRYGPANWELGRYPEGQADHPVSGVSWYEAVAYSRSQGGTLPTLYHWNLATHGPATLTLSTPLAALMTSLANIGGRPVRPVGETGSIGANGTFDAAGNVREWVWNEGVGENRWILGGSASEAVYAFTLPYELPPFDRSPQNGFRIMLPEGDVDAPLLAPAVIETRDYRRVEPVSDDGFAVLRAQFEYDRDAVRFGIAEREDIGSYRWEAVTVTPEHGESFDVYLIIPTNAEPPWPAVVYFPPRGFFLGEEIECATRLRSELERPPPILTPTTSIPDMGRVLAVPVWTGACERYDDFAEAQPRTQVQLRGRRIRAWHEELARTLDYLDARDDISSDAYGYFGWSFGGSRPLPLLALEERLSTAVLMSAGFPHGEWPQIADAVNYVGRTTLPVLMLGGRLDAYRPVDLAQRPFYDLLGTPAAHKRLVIFEAGHFPLPRAGALREIADWLDRYLPRTGRAR